MVMRKPSVLALLLSVAVQLTGPAAARAETVLFACSESCPLTLFEALELELRGHGARLVARLSPSGTSVDEHEADARRMAESAPAIAVVWVEHEAPVRVRVARPYSAYVNEAPLSALPEEIEARTFASIAGNVVLAALEAPAASSPLVLADEPVVANTSAPAPQVTPIHAETRESEPKPAAKANKLQRFFLRAGAAFGFPYLTSGLPSDRPPPKELVNDALGNAINMSNPDAALEYLAQHGYECSERVRGNNSLIFSQCHAAVDKKGFVFAPGIDLQAGAYISQRFALALVVRIAPEAGEGTFNHALLGVQVEDALIVAKPRGFWMNGGLGFAGGHFQIKANTHNYAVAGMLEAHALLALGYRFVPNFGVYATGTLRVLFPDTLFMLEPTVGVEVRL